MPTEEPIARMLERARALSDRCLETDSPDECGLLDQTIREVDATARSAIQSMLAPQLHQIADKLDAGMPLTVEDERNLERFAIGSAARYVDVENNVADWKAEVRRLLGELDHASVEDGSRDLDRLLHVRALCRDAMNVLPDLRLWMEERERVSRFRDGAWERERQRGHAVARFIRESLRHDQS